MSSDWFNSLLSEKSYFYGYLDKGSGLQKKKSKRRWYERHLFKTTDIFCLNSKLYLCMSTS